MSSVAALRLRIERMTAAIQQQNAPRIVDCTGARDALTQEELQAFKAMLTQMVQEDEERGVKLVSRGSES